MILTGISNFELSGDAGAALALREDGSIVKWDGHGVT